MKIFLTIFLPLALASSSFGAQVKTIILVRHAEKDVSATANKYDPVLNEEGKKRAWRLYETVKIFQPVFIFSTNLLRTRQTAEPTAANLHRDYRIFVEAYKPEELEKFAEYLLSLRTNSILVVGHSNTTPQLANLLLKEQKYKDFADSEYDKIIIVKIKRKKATGEIISY